MDARFGLEVERILHLLERGRDAGLAEMVVDVAKKLMLLARQHCRLLGTNAERVGNVGIAVKRAARQAELALMFTYPFRSAARHVADHKTMRLPFVVCMSLARAAHCRGPRPFLLGQAQSWS